MKLGLFANRKPVTREAIDYTNQINNAIDREIAIGRIDDVSDDDRQTLVAQAQTKIAKISAAGLKLCVRPDGELRCFLHTRHDHLTAADLATEFGKIDNYISETGYYTLDLPTALTDLEIGEYGCWVFAVYDEQAEGYRADMQAMFTDYKWVKQVELFDAFAAKYANAGTIFSLDHASQGMLHAHDAQLPDWNANALGRIGYNRFIKLPTDVEINGKKHQLFPSGGADVSVAGWNAGDWGDAYDDYGVVALVG